MTAPVGSRTAPGLPSLALLFNALAWGVSWWPLRQLDTLGLHPLWATAGIYVCAVVVITFTQSRAWGQLARTPALWAVMVAAGTTNAAFNWAVTIGDVVRVVLLFYLMPLWTVMLAGWLLKERFTVFTLVRMALALLGAAAVLSPADTGLTWPVPRSLADALGVAGGFFFALNNVMLRREAARSEASRALAMFLGGAVIAGGTAAALAGAQMLPWLPAPAWPWVVGMLLMSLLFLCSNFALQYGAAHLPANATAVIMMSEILFATMSSVWLGSTELRPAVLWGGSLILLAALLSLWPERRRAE